MSASSGRSAVRLSRAAAARPYASSNGPGAGTTPRIRRPRTAATSSQAVTIRYAATVSVAARAAWVEKLACSSSPRDSTAVPSAAGEASCRMSAKAECATYSRLSTPELAGALPARNGRSPVMAGSTSVPSRPRAAPRRAPAVPGAAPPGPPRRAVPHGPPHGLSRSSGRCRRGRPAPAPVLFRLTWRPLPHVTNSHNPQAVVLTPSSGVKSMKRPIHPAVLVNPLSRWADAEDRSPGTDQPPTSSEATL